MEKIKAINSVIYAINEANIPNDRRLMPSDITEEQLNRYIDAYKKRFGSEMSRETMTWLYDFADNLPHSILYFIKYIMDIEQ